MSNAALPAQGRTPRAAPLRLSIARRCSASRCGCSSPAAPSPASNRRLTRSCFVLALLVFGARGLAVRPQPDPADHRAGAVQRRRRAGAGSLHRRPRQRHLHRDLGLYLDHGGVLRGARRQRPVGAHAHDPLGLCRGRLHRERALRSSAISTSAASASISRSTDRASGTFKDPNVLGPFLAPPLVWLAQDIMLQARRADGAARFAAAC